MILMLLKWAGPESAKTNRVEWSGANGLLPGKTGQQVLQAFAYKAWDTAPG